VVFATYRSRVSVSWGEETDKKAHCTNEPCDAGTARQYNASSPNWLGGVLPARLPGTLTKVYIGMLKQSAQEPLMNGRYYVKARTGQRNNSSGSDDA
jgi:hypothetical protein